MKWVIIIIKQEREGNLTLMKRERI